MGTDEYEAHVGGRGRMLAEHRGLARGRRGCEEAVHMWMKESHGKQSVPAWSHCARGGAAAGGVKELLKEELM